MYLSSDYKIKELENQRLWLNWITSALKVHHRDHKKVDKVIMLYKAYLIVL